MDIFGTHFPSYLTCSITNLVSTLPICNFCRLWFLRFQAMHLRSSYHLEEMMVGADNSNMTPNTFLIKALHDIQWHVSMAHVQYVRILTWLWGVRDKITNIFSRLHCLAIPRRDWSTKKTKPNIEVWPESLPWGHVRILIYQTWAVQIVTCWFDLIHWHCKMEKLDANQYYQPRWNLGGKGQG